MDTQDRSRNARTRCIWGGGGLFLELWPSAFSGLVRIESRDSLLVLHCEDIYRRQPFGL